MVIQRRLGDKSSPNSSASNPLAGGVMARRPKARLITAGFDIHDVSFRTKIAPTAHSCRASYPLESPRASKVASLPTHKGHGAEFVPERVEQPRTVRPTQAHRPETPRKACELSSPSVSTSDGIADGVNLLRTPGSAHSRQRVPPIGSELRESILVDGRIWQKLDVGVELTAEAQEAIGHTLAVWEHSPGDKGRIKLLEMVGGPPSDGADLRLRRVRRDTGPGATHPVGTLYCCRA